MTRSLPTKTQIIHETCELLGLRPLDTTVGSSIPSVFFTDVAAVMGIPIVSGMPAMARKIIENSGLLWHPDFSSENAPSGGGGTVTALGLLQLKNAALLWLGHSPEEMPSAYEDWKPALDWITKRENLTRETREAFSRPGSIEFREKVLDSYTQKCAVSGISSLQAIEVAHIVPYYGNESDHIQNAIPLRADIHKLFDKGLLIIYFSEDESKIKIKCHDFILKDYGNFHNKDLILPVDINDSPSRLALIEHQKLFKEIWQEI
jgi:hypothetical protein